MYKRNQSEFLKEILLKFLTKFSWICSTNSLDFFYTNSHWFLKKKIFKIFVRNYPDILKILPRNCGRNSGEFLWETLRTFKKKFPRIARKISALFIWFFFSAFLKIIIKKILGEILERCCTNPQQSATDVFSNFWNKFSRKFLRKIFKIMRKNVC